VPPPVLTDSSQSGALHFIPRVGLPCGPTLAMVPLVVLACRPSRQPSSPLLLGLPMPPPSNRFFAWYLAFTRCSFTTTLLCTSQSSLYCPPPGLTPVRERSSSCRYLAFTRSCHSQYCMVYGIQKRSGGGVVVFCAIVVQSYCISAGNAGGRG